MTPVIRRAIPVLMAGLAIANTGCGSKSSERTPTGPRPPAVDSDAQGVRATAVAPSLGAAGSFAVLGMSTVTNTGPTALLGLGDLGVSSAGGCTGFPAPCTGGGPGTLTGVIHSGDAVATNAQLADVAAFGALASQACNLVLTGTDLGGLTLTPGVYCFASSAQLTGTLTLDGLGNAGSVWVFQIGSTLTTASNSRVAFINGGQACGTFWQVGSSATLGTNTNFNGNILALASISLNTGAMNNGALLAQTAAVTLDSNRVTTVGSCGSGPQPSPTPIGGGGGGGGGGVPALPHGMEWALLVILVGIGTYILRRH